MRSFAALAVALLLVLAGCSGTPGDDGTTVETTTDAVEMNPDEGDLPPGLSASGVSDPESLVDTHAGVLRNTSYTVESDMTVRDAETLLARSNATVRVGAGGLPASQQYRIDGERPEAVGLYGDDVETWADENGTWYATDGPNGTEYRRVPDEHVRSPSVQTGRDHLYVLFTGLNATLAGTETRDGTTLYRVNATGASDAQLLAGTLRGDEVSNVSLSALVGEDGVVHRYRVEYDAAVADETTRVERTVRFTALGETTVERPVWYDEAVNATDGGA